VRGKRRIKQPIQEIQPPGDSQFLDEPRAHRKYETQTALWGLSDRSGSHSEQGSSTADTGKGVGVLWGPLRSPARASLCSVRCTAAI
jgi:hypothetical protein